MDKELSEVYLCGEALKILINAIVEANNLSESQKLEVMMSGSESIKLKVHELCSINKE